MRTAAQRLSEQRSWFRQILFHHSRQFHRTVKYLYLLK